MLLDRFGPRRVEPALLMLAGLGGAGLRHGRRRRWPRRRARPDRRGLRCRPHGAAEGDRDVYPPERQASLAGWMMVAGGSGALLATAPLEAALHVTSWRVVFVVLAVRDVSRLPSRSSCASRIRPGTRTRSASRRSAGLRSVLHAPAVLVDRSAGRFGMGSFMAISGPVVGAVADRGRGLLARRGSAAPPRDGAVMLAGYLATWPLCHTARAPRHLRASPVRRRLRLDRARARRDRLSRAGNVPGGGRRMDSAR